jgi:hypothetical protein
LFIPVYKDSHWDLQLPPEVLVQALYSRFADNPSPFFDRLELLSCFRTIWKLEPIELTADEKEEMEYELSYDYVSDEDLQYLGIDIPERPREAEQEPQAKEKPPADDDDDLGFGLFDSSDDAGKAPKPDHTPVLSRLPQRRKYQTTPRKPDYSAPPYLRDKDGKIQVGYRLLEEPYCYTWERVVSGKCRMPLRVEWDDYWEDGMVSAVYDFVMKFE